jgi:hypothetical protein
MCPPYPDPGEMEALRVYLHAALQHAKAGVCGQRPWQRVPYPSEPREPFPEPPREPGKQPATWEEARRAAMYGKRL